MCSVYHVSCHSSLWTAFIEHQLCCYLNDVPRRLVSPSFPHTLLKWLECRSYVINASQKLEEEQMNEQSLVVSCHAKC